MKIVVFGLSISSAWGNGHATLLRGLFRALHGRGHQVHFFERDVPYYASHRDAASFPFVHLHLYSDWAATLPFAKMELAGADAAMVTSYCPDGAAASELILESNIPRKVFYDMDTPVTLERFGRGEPIDYLPRYGFSGFDVVLSYTGGESLSRLRDSLSAKCTAPLYGWVDPLIHHRVDVSPQFKAVLSYLGTYSADRQPALQELLVDPAEQLTDSTFVIGGAMYPSVSGWPKNIRHYEHVVPADHCAFYSSSPLTLSITRASFAAVGYCPSGRLFEASACGTAVLSDWWEGLDTFLEPNQEILIATSKAEALRALSMPREELDRIGARARERTLDCHTADIRAQRLLDLIETPRDESAIPEHGMCLTEGAA
ncbi:MAG: glycosyltransferase [Acidobacteriota bacterium]|nr:glycosyltransferase [Acidobacteriota bacterium]